MQLHSAKRYTFKSNLESTNGIISVKISVIGSIYHYVPQIGYLEIYIIKVFYYFSMFSQMGFELLFYRSKEINSPFCSFDAHHHSPRITKYLVIFCCALRIYTWLVILDTKTSNRSINLFEHIYYGWSEIKVWYKSYQAPTILLKCNKVLCEFAGF